MADLLLDVAGRVLGTAGLTAFFIWLLQTSVAKKLEARIEGVKAQHAGDLETLKFGLRRIEQLETDLFELRATGYGKIWRLTGSLNLFGPDTKLAPDELSNSLREWYFDHGHVLQNETKGCYFLAQEVLNFARVRSLEFARPSDEVLYAVEGRTVDKLDALRREYFTIEMSEVARGEGSRRRLEDLVTEWKRRLLAESVRDEQDPQRNWVLLQLLLSALRTRLQRDLRIVNFVPVLGGTPERRSI